MAEYSNNIIIYYIDWFYKSDVSFLQTLNLDKTMKKLSGKYFLENSIIVNKALI